MRLMTARKSGRGCGTGAHLRHSSVQHQPWPGVCHHCAGCLQRSGRRAGAGFRLDDSLDSRRSRVHFHFGATAGKALLRVKVTNPDGRNLSYPQALSRSFNVWLRGLGIGIPLVSL